MKPVFLSAIVYFAVTAIIGRDVLRSLGTAIANDPGDPVLNAAILAWNAMHVPWTDAWYQFPIFHPTGNTLTFSEHLLGVSVLASPIYWITGNALTAYNLTLLLAYPLSGLAMYALVWRLTRHHAAAFLAGLAFAFTPYRASHLPQIQVQVMFWAPLALLGLHEFVARSGRPLAERWRWLALYAVAWMLQGASNGYLLVFFSLLVGLWLLWFAAASRRWFDLAMISAATLAAALPLVPILVRYVTTHEELGLGRNLGEIAAFGADIGGLLCAPAGLTFWGWLQVACGPEGELFVGAGLVALCVAGAILRPGTVAPPSPVPASSRAVSRALAATRVAAFAGALVFVAIAMGAAVFGPWSLDFGPVRASASGFDKPLSTAAALLLIVFVLSPTVHRVVRRGSTTTFYLGAAVVCWVLAWGPFPRLFGVEVLYQAPFAWLLRLPGVDGLRVPARFWMVSVICLCVFLGLVLAQWLRARKSGTSFAVVALATAVLLADGWTAIPAARVPGDVPDAAALRGATVLSLPVGDLYPDIAAGHRAVKGEWRSVNGYSGYEPGYYGALRALSRMEDESLLRPFLERGDLHVLVAEGEQGLISMVERQSGVRLVTRNSGMRHYWLPAAPPDGEAGVSLEGRERVPIRSVTTRCDAAGVPRITDGNIETQWVCGAQGGEDQDVTVDAGSASRLGGVVLSFGRDGSAFPRDLTIETSIDGREWEAAWLGSPAAEVLAAGLESPLIRVPLLFDPRPARYVRLRQRSRDYPFWSIGELELWSGPR